MGLIQNNSYRIAGILSNATERELQKQKAEIKAFSKVGKEIKSEYDFKIFNNISRHKDPSEEAFNLIKYAKSIAVGTQTKDRVNENLEGIQEWAETAPIKEDLTYVTLQLKNFQDANNSIQNTKRLIEICKPKLNGIGQTLGRNDEFYLNRSSNKKINNLNINQYVKF